MNFLINLFSKFKYNLVLLLCSAFLSACSKTSQVDFKGDRASGDGSTIKTGSGVLSSTGGGFTNQTTSSGFTVSASHGASLNKTVSGTTASGYKVDYNIQAQIAQ